MYAPNSSPLTFSTNYNTGQGIGFTRVVINATGSGISYSDYLTSCGSTGIETTTMDVPARKYLRSGQLFIQVGESIFSITGQRLH